MTAPLTRYQRKNDRGHLQPHPNGAWVKWAEVEARLADLQRERDEAVNQVATYAAQALDLTERLEHAQAQVAWQPIETAPKDGTLFIGWVASERWSSIDGEGSGRAHDTSQVDFCWWCNALPEVPDSGYFDNASGRIGDGQDITHWMPLPLPPAPGASK